MNSKEKNSKVNIGIVLLAAGNSSRLGKPKQLLSYNHQSLLQNAIQAASESDAQPVVVVLGSGADKLKKEAGNTAIHIDVNTEWEEGMASSIRRGLTALTEINSSAE